MTCVGSYQFSLRRLLTVVTAIAVGLWLLLQLFTSVTPPRGETLVTDEEQALLSAMRDDLDLIYCDKSTCSAPRHTRVIAKWSLTDGCYRVTEIELAHAMDLKPYLPYLGKLPGLTCVKVTEAIPTQVREWKKELRPRCEIRTFSGR